MGLHQSTTKSDAIKIQSNINSVCITSFLKIVESKISSGYYQQKLSPVSVLTYIKKVSWTKSHLLNKLKSGSQIIESYLNWLMFFLSWLFVPQICLFWLFDHNGLTCPPGLNSHILYKFLLASFHSLNIEHCHSLNIEHCYIHYTNSTFS